MTACFKLNRWLGDAVSVSARAKTVVKMRTDLETQELVGVRIPDHIDILVSIHAMCQLPFRRRGIACLEGD